MSERERRLCSLAPALSPKVQCFLLSMSKSCGHAHLPPPFRMAPVWSNETTAALYYLVTPMGEPVCSSFGATLGLAHFASRKNLHNAFCKYVCVGAGVLPTLFLHSILSGSGRVGICPTLGVGEGQCVCTISLYCAKSYKIHIYMA